MMTSMKGYLFITLVIELTTISNSMKRPKISPDRAPSISVALRLFHGVPIRDECVVHLALGGEAAAEQIEAGAGLRLCFHSAVETPDGSPRARRWLAQGRTPVVQPPWQQITPLMRKTTDVKHNPN